MQKYVYLLEHHAGKQPVNVGVFTHISGESQKIPQDASEESGICRVSTSNEHMSHARPEVGRRPRRLRSLAFRYRRNGGDRDRQEGSGHPKTEKKDADMA